MVCKQMNSAPPNRAQSALLLCARHKTLNSSELSWGLSRKGPFLPWLVPLATLSLSRPPLGPLPLPSDNPSLYFRKTQNPVPRGALVAKSERAALAEFSSMNHFGKLVRLNGLRRKNVLIGSRGGSAVSICSLNRWGLDLLNYTNSKYPSAGRAASESSPHAALSQPQSRALPPTPDHKSAILID